MRRLRFVPARDSRHRTAALSLYRALLRSANSVPLPEELCSAGPRNIIAHVVRKRFINNRPYTSYRLTYASMVAGYKFLTLFSKARSPASPEHSQLITHARSILATAAASRANKPQSSCSASPTTPRGPLLQKVSNQNDPPRYQVNYLPRTHANPRVCATADGQPFLRVKNFHPQPTSLSKMIGRKGRIFNQKILNLVEIDEILTHDASLEDQWEKLVAAQMKREHGAGQEKGVSVEQRQQTSLLDSFSWSVQLSRLWWEWQIEKTWRDWCARGEALSTYVDAMQDSVAAEAQKPGKKRQSMSLEHGGNKTARQMPSERPNVGVYAAPAFPLITSIERTLRGRRDNASDPAEDPFRGSAWHALVESQKPRLLRRAALRTASVNGTR